jgi:hypothetical protein
VINQLNKDRAAAHMKDGDLTKKETRVFHSIMADAKEIRTISQQKVLAIIIVKNQESERVSNACY